jgi:hypothetical protein
MAHAKIDVCSYVYNIQLDDNKLVDRLFSFVHMLDLQM